MSYQESENDDGEYEKFSDNESNAEGFLSTLKVDESNADTSKGLPTLRLEAWASWRGPSGVVCLVVTPDGVDGPTI